MSKKKYPLYNDCVFHRVFGTEETKNNLVYLINTVFQEIKVKQVEYVSIMDSVNYGKTVKDKKVVFDIKARTNADNLVNVEIQLEGKKHYIERSCIYLCKTHGDQVPIGEEYDIVKDTYGISLVDFILFKKHPGCVNLFSFTHWIDKDCTLGQVEMIYVEMPKVKMINKNSKPIEKLIYLIKNVHNSEDKTVPILRAEKPALDQICIDYNKTAEDKEFMAYLEAREKYRRDVVAEKAYARDEGLAEGLAKGKAEGIAEGKAEGLVEGEAKGKTEIVNSMLSEGLDIKTISRFTKITEAEVQQIIDNSAE